MKLTIEQIKQMIFEELEEAKYSKAQTQKWQAQSALIKRPPYSLPISLQQLRNEIDSFIIATQPQPKGAALQSKKAIIKAGVACHDTFGLCFDVATLLQHMAGGKKFSGLTKKQIRKFPYISPTHKAHSIDSKHHKTSHWYLSDQKGTTIDPTAQQFRYGIRPDYSKGRGREIGSPHFGQKHKIHSYYDETVPGTTVRKLARAFKEWNKKTNGKNTAYGMDWWLGETGRLGITEQLEIK